VSGAVVATLLAALQQLAGASGVTLAVDVELLEHPGAAVGVQADRAMPMASTFKLPLAVAVLRESERGALPALDGSITIVPADMHAHASPLYERLGKKGGRTTLREALTQLLEASDNSAADALVRLAGGGAKVTATLRALGLDGMTIDRNEAEMGRDLDRVGVAKFDADPRDHTTPAAMVKLLGKLWRGQLLGAAATAFVEEHMARCHTGLGRLRAGLPEKTPVADRTGTCGAAWCANDVAVVTLPSGEHALVAVYVSGAAPTAAKEKLMADVGRALWAEYARAPEATRAR
jgi:beta-lactamase class A